MTFSENKGRNVFYFIRCVVYCVIINRGCNPTKHKIMTKERTEQAVRELFRDNMRLYPENYTDSLKEAVETAVHVAEGYWDNRTEEEMSSDYENEITQEDYVLWCIREIPAMLEWIQCESNESGLQIDNVSDLEKWTGEDISGKYDFDQLCDGRTFHFSSKINNGDEVNFVFSVERLDKWGSELNLKQVELI